MISFVHFTCFLTVTSYVRPFAPASHSENQCFPGLHPSEDPNILFFFSFFLNAWCYDIIPIWQDGRTFSMSLPLLAFKLLFLTPFPPLLAPSISDVYWMIGPPRIKAFKRHWVHKNKQTKNESVFLIIGSFLETQILVQGDKKIQQALRPQMQFPVHS